MSSPWLSIIGIGEDGVEGLSGEARGLIANAALVMGGERHLRLARSLVTGEAQAWPRPIADALPGLLAQRPKPVVALASGDPFCFGVGPLLAGAVVLGEWRCLPKPSCVSLACARLGWALQDATVISFCGRPLAPLARCLHQGARILALSEDAATPAAVAAFLCAQGFGDSEIVVLEALGGPDERVRSGTAAGFDIAAPNRLNMLAIAVAGRAVESSAQLAPGLPDDAFLHDGQITKREIRAATLSALAPRPGQLLWDIGTGSGSVAIEWALCHPSLRAVAVDRRADRLARARENAARLGAAVEFIEADAENLGALLAPDAVFIGGGAQRPGVIAACLAALPVGGRIVVNAVTIETEAVLLAAFHRHGGTLTRIGVERIAAVGGMHGFRPAMTVLQWAATRT